MPLAALTALTLAALAHAPAAADGWSFRVTPYLWTPSVDLTSEVDDDPPASGSGSILDFIEGALLLDGEARGESFTVLAELNYLGFGEDAEGENGLISGTVELDGWMGAAAVAVPVHDSGAARVEALAGLRAWSLETTVDFDSFPAASARETWVDPLVGARATFDLAERLEAQILADVGGFGVGSELQWQAVGRATWRLDDGFGIAAGYRHLDLRFDDGTGIELTLSGPFVALDIWF